jgi:hypothetical protein
MSVRRMKADFDPRLIAARSADLTAVSQLPHFLFDAEIPSSIVSSRDLMQFTALSLPDLRRGVN